jgi:hypothetical protein
MKLCYVAGAITKGDIADNVARAHDAGLALLKAGLAVVVPHGSVFWGNARFNLWGDPDPEGRLFVPEASPAGTTHEMWLKCDLEIVRRCDAVFRVPGESVGADMETAEAARRGIPVYTDIETLIKEMGGDVARVSVPS